MVDVSITGAQVHADDVKYLQHGARVLIELAGRELEAAIRSIRRKDDHTVYGIEFIDLDPPAREFLLDLANARMPAER